MSKLAKKSSYNIAIIGATGAVGIEMLKVLEDRKFPIGELKLFASPNSVGKSLKFKGKDIPLQVVDEGSFAGIDIALFSAGSSRSKEHAPLAVKAGAVVIDNSSAFRMDPTVPLVVPEINPEDALNHNGVIANPNCTTIIMGVAIWPIHKINPIKRVIVSTYQAVSGAGAQALDELRAQRQAVASGQAPQAKIFPHVIVDNLFSHNTTIGADGLNEEERKMVNETRKIFGDKSIQIAPTCIRVPIERAHSEAINLELSHPVDLKTIHQVLERAPGVKIVDNTEKNHFPMPIEASHKDDVLVGRIRLDESCANGLALFVCGDQLLKGAALNAVQIAELLIS